MNIIQKNLEHSGLTTEAEHAAYDDLDIAVLVPCYNEEVAIAKVVRDFAAALPEAKIYIYDNCSTDRTAEVARAAGAVVRAEPLRGKGNVVASRRTVSPSEVRWKTLRRPVEQRPSPRPHAESAWRPSRAGSCS